MSEPRTRQRRHRAGWVGVVAGLLLLAVAVALAWWLVVPDTPVLASADLDLVASPGPSDDVLATADGAFAGLCLLAGVLVAVALLLRARERLLLWASVCLAGGALAAAAAWQLGRLIGPPSVAAQQAAGVQTLHAPLDLSTPLVVLLWPGATATVLFVVLLAWLLIKPPSAD